MTDPTGPWASATEIADAVSKGSVRAVAVAEAALARISAANPVLGAYTDVTAERALAMAAAVDEAVAAGRPVGPLAGVPFAVKNLYDVAGLPTRAGSRINRERAPAAADAVLVRRMAAAGAVLLGTLNMGEYAYDFTGENAHDGACRNPHDPGRMSGGSSSGCGAATAAGLAPVSLGSDTNGSLRVPASLCGVFSLKPTYGRLPRTGTFPFVDSLDHLGPFARTARDLAARLRRAAGAGRRRSRLCAAPPGPGGAAARGAAATARRRARRLVPRERRRGGAGRGRPGRRRAGAPRRGGHAAAGRGRGGPGGRLPDHQRGERGLPPAAVAGARRRLRSRHARPLPRRSAAAGRLGRAGAAGPALVAGTGARRLSAFRPAGGAGDALPGPGRGDENAGPCRAQPPAPTEPRPSRDAVLLHRPAGRHRAAVRRPPDAGRLTPRWTRCGWTRPRQAGRRPT